MRRLASIVALLLLLGAAAPTMACVTGMAMNHQQNDCCVAMHGQCGEMAKQGCCRVQTRTDNSQLPAHDIQLNIHWTVSLNIAPSLDSTLSNTSRLPKEHAPPGLLTAKTTVLRI